MGVLLYEMTVGLPPFYNEDKVKMYRDIASKKLQIPAILNGPIRDLLEGLLEKDPRKRLGSSRGISEIKEHSFFADLDWVALAKKQSPINNSRPPIDVNIFECNFDKEYTSIPIEIKPAEEELGRDDPFLVIETQRKRSNSYCYGLRKAGSRKSRNRIMEREQPRFLGQFEDFQLRQPDTVPESFPVLRHHASKGTTGPILGDDL